MLRPAAIFVVISLAAAARAQTPGFWFIPVQSGETIINIYWLSRDGSRAAGGIAYTGAAFVWTAATGRQIIDDGRPESEDIRGMSADGQVMAGTTGQSGYPYYTFPYRRVGQGPFQQLPPPNGFVRGTTIGLSDSGDAVAGTWWQVVQSSSTPQPFFWSPSGGTVLLGQLNYQAQAYGLSRDGTTVVGGSGTYGAGFVWKQETGFQWLPPPQVTYYDYVAAAVNTNGSIIVGTYSAPAGSGIVRWVSGVAQDLGVAQLGAVAVSDDGATIAAQPNSSTPYVWTEQGGYTTAAAYFQARGVALPGALTLYYITAISPDGRTFAGTGSLSGTGGAFVVTIAPPCGSADFNNDGDTGTDLDIESFFACIAGDCCPTCGSPDFNGDGDFGTDADIEAFFRVLAGGPC